jgi:hypothetical protein
MCPMRATFPAHFVLDLITPTAFGDWYYNHEASHYAVLSSFRYFLFFRFIYFPQHPVFIALDVITILPWKKIFWYRQLPREWQWGDGGIQLFSLSVQVSGGVCVCVCGGWVGVDPGMKQKRRLLTNTVRIQAMPPSNSITRFFIWWYPLAQTFESCFKGRCRRRKGFECGDYEKAENTLFEGCYCRTRMRILFIYLFFL